MAAEDKTYCGRGERDEALEMAKWKTLAERPGITREAIASAIEKVGYDYYKVEALLLGKESAY